MRSRKRQTRRCSRGLHALLSDPTLWCDVDVDALVEDRAQHGESTRHVDRSCLPVVHHTAGSRAWTRNEECVAGHAKLLSTTLSSHVPDMYSAPSARLLTCRASKLLLKDASAAADCVTVHVFLA